MTNEDIIAQLKEVLQVIRPKADLSQVNENTELVKELGIDSLTMLLLSLATEEKFKIRFDSDVPVGTVGQLVGYIRKKLA